MKFVSIVGARPEFIQATPVSRVLRQRHTEILVHTGQHYDYKMSQTFFDELGTPAPDYNLEVGSGQHGKQTADILIGIEQVLLQEQPDWVIVRGDTNSTVAGALAASKLHIPLAHIEAGERSFDKRMPEEINRLVADRISDLHFCVSRTALKHLSDEGITRTAHHVGDVMLDAMLYNQTIAARNSTALQTLGLSEGAYVLVTVHRAANTDDPARLRGIVQALNAAGEPVVFPVHPRTRKKIEDLGVVFAPNVKAIEPVGYFDMITLEANARLIATDSGGVQREAYFLGKPCITLRDETEWTETVDVGWNTLVGTEPNQILQAWRNFSPPSNQPPIFGDGCAAQKIVTILEN
jgi:UDP-GlcNAc3NAcA epimerase